MSYALSILCSLFNSDVVNKFLEGQEKMSKKLNEEVKAAKKKAELVIQSKRNHAPGKRHKLPDGTTYQVSRSGAWVRTSMKLVEQRNADGGVRVAERHAIMDRLLGGN